MILLIKVVVSKGIKLDQRMIKDNTNCPPLLINQLVTLIERILSALNILSP